MKRPARRISEVDLARAWINWRVDTPSGYLETLLTLRRRERVKDRGASFPSLQDIFVHILDNNVWWFESVPKARQDSHQGVEGRLSDVEIRREARREDRTRAREVLDVRSPGPNFRGPRCPRQREAVRDESEPTDDDLALGRRGAAAPRGNERPVLATGCRRTDPGLVQ